MWSDTHCHLDLLDPHEIEKARCVGVHRFLVPGITGCPDNIPSFVEAHKDVYFAVGIHPLFINQTSPATWYIMEEIAAHPKCVAIGEIGLDYFNKPVDKISQRMVLERQFALAEKMNLPIVIHLRRAFPDFLSALERVSPLKVVMHMYSGSLEFSTALGKSSHEVYFSFGGPATNPNAHRAHQVLTHLPVDRILLETDAPDLPPHGTEPPNSPANLPLIGARIANLLNISVEQLASQTSQNAREVFQW